MQTLSAFLIYLTYGMLGILFLFTVIKSFIYMRSPRRAPERAELDERLLNTLNDRREPE